jgi:hypothetical protein
MKTRRVCALAASLTLSATVTATAVSASQPAHSAAEADQATLLISHALGGGLPNGPSTNAVISDDKRFARVIAFESYGSDLVPGDTNGAKDVFAVMRGGSFGNDGSPWQAGRTVLVSRGLGGKPANGPSFSPAVDGGFHSGPSCVAFLSAASNLVPNDKNGRVDAFVAKLSGGSVRRVKVGAKGAATDVAVSGDCKKVAVVAGGKLFVASGGHTKRIKTKGAASSPSFSTGLRSDLVFAAKGGVYLARKAKGKAKLVGPGGRNPVYNDIKRQVVAYEVARGGYTQIAYRDLGKKVRIASQRGGILGNGDSHQPVIGNSGYYIAFQTEASNLGVNATGREGDDNSRPDTYLYTNTRDITLIQSVAEKGTPLPGGGENPSMSFYANYIVFDSPAPIGMDEGAHQVFMRYLGPV